MRSKFVFLTGLLVSWLTASAALAGTAQIYAYKTVAGQEYAQPAAYFSLKMCRVSQPSLCYYASTTDGYGHGTVNIGLGFEGYYNLFLYKNYGVNYGGEWGSQNQPIAAFYIPSGLTSIAVSVAPRPLPPTLVAPCNSCRVNPGNFYLKWTDGLDSQRRTSLWPVTYDIWASETPVGWPTQPEKLTVADAPCNPDSLGRCQWYVDALVPESGRRYTWRIVVKLNVGGGTVYTTSGPSWSLSQY